MSVPEVLDVGNQRHGPVMPPTVKMSGYANVVYETNNPDPLAIIREGVLDRINAAEPGIVEVFESGPPGWYALGYCLLSTVGGRIARTYPTLFPSLYRFAVVEVDGFWSDAEGECWEFVVGESTHSPTKDGREA